MPQDETPIVKSILDGLKLFYRHDGYFWRQNNHGVFDRKTKRYRFNGTKGVSDILGVLRGGRMVAIEVKTPKAFAEAKNHGLSKFQIEFLQRVKDQGGLTIVATDFEKVKTIIDKQLQHEQD